MSRSDAHHTPFFPIARYTSLVGVHSSLILFNALFLPRTSLSDILPVPLLHLLPAKDATPAFTKGADHPQPKFLEALTASPSATLAWLCVGLAVLQVWWAGWLRAWANEYQQSLLGGSTAAEDAAKKEEERLTRSKGAGLFKADSIERFREAAACALLGAGVFHGALVLGGAPFASHIPHTALFASLLSILAIYPAAFVLGPPVHLGSFISKSQPSNVLTRRYAWTRLFAEISPNNPVEIALLYPAIGAVGGSWAGMIPLALDWERPWQQWPLPPAYAAVLGSVFGAMGACAVICFDQLVKAGNTKTTVEPHPMTVEEETVKKGRSSKDVKVKATGKDSEKFEGNAAVEEMRKSVQAVLQGMSAARKEDEDGEDDDQGGDDVAEGGAKKKRRRRRRGGKGHASEEAS